MNLTFIYRGTDQNFLGNAQWTLAGPGRLSADPGGATAATYTAPDVAGTATITATGGGCTCRITFHTIPPSIVNRRIAPGTHTRHVHLTADVGIKSWVYFGPDTVSFMNIHYREVNVPPTTTTGIYNVPGIAGVLHDPHGTPAEPAASATVVPGLGTQGTSTDTAESGSPPNVVPPYANSTEIYDIPVQYRVGGAWHPVATVRQEATMDNHGNLTMRKAGATSTPVTVNGPTTDY